MLAYAPSDPNIIFALYDRSVVSSCTGTAVPEAKFFRYDAGLASWTDLSANLPNETGCSDGNDPFAVQGGYNLAIAVKPDNANTVFIGGTNIYKSTDGFTTTTNTSRIGGYNSSANYAPYPNSHPDIHSLLFNSASNDMLFSGNDGGIQKADITSGTVTWTPLNNNYVTYQYYHADILPVSGSDILVGGAQDNGTTLNSGGTTASSIFGGDGVAVGMISYVSPTSFNVIAGSQIGNLVRLTGPSAGFGIKPTGSTSIFVTYFNLDQDNTNHLFYAGSATLYRTRNASAISSGTIGSAATEWETMSGAGISGNIRSLATSRNKAYADATYAASDANRKLYIGTETGKVYRLNDPAYVAEATVAVDITPAGAPTAVLSSIAINPSDDNEIIITYSNYNVNSVYHTANANAATPTWTIVEGPAGNAVQLASIRSSAIVKVAGVTQYYVGTSVGLFSTTSLSGATTNWSRVGSSEINYSLVNQMRYRPADNKILASTHGNGMFLVNLPDPFVLAIKLQNFDAVKQGEQNALVKWKVGFSSTAKKFEVMKSSDGRNFKSITIVNAKLNGTDYNFVDNALAVGKNYYKLKMFDEDGSISFSNTAVVYYKYNGFEISSMIPTLVSNTASLNIAATVKGNGTLVVADAVGKRVYHQSVLLLAGNNNFNLDLSKLSAGVYFIYGLGGNEKSNTVRFVKE